MVCTYTSGYRAAYLKIGEILGHQPDNVNAVMETLAGKLTQDEFYGLAILLERTGTRIRDLEGNVCIDIWGEMNGCQGGAQWVLALQRSGSKLRSSKSWMATP